MSKPKFLNIIVGLASFLIPFMGSSLSLALPLIQQDLSVNVVLLSWIPTVFVLANAAFLLPFGRLADIYGIKKIFFYGVMLYAAASLLATFSFSGIILIIFSFLQGVGCAMIFSTGVALLTVFFPPEKRGEAFGLYVTAVYAGLFVGPLLGGFLIQNLGWRSIFFFNVPFGLFILLLTKWKFKKERKANNGEFDLKGSLLYIPMIIALIYGLTTLQEDWSIIILILGLITLFIFILWERNTENPLLEFAILKNRITVSSGLALLLMNTATAAMWTLLSLYLQDIRLFNSEFTALILVVQPLMVVLISPVIGRISNYKTDWMLSAGGVGLATLGC